jgi:CheY-like chemotaxis protein
MPTILIVDDLSANRKYLMALLGANGHRMLEAADGSLALEVVRHTRPDLIITDVLMPVTDGYELVRQLRLDPATRQIPVIFYTAHYGEREARVLARSSGVSYVLTKPTDSATVLSVVGRALRGESEGGDRPAAALSVQPGALDRAHLALLTDQLSEKRKPPTPGCARSSTSAWRSPRSGTPTGCSTTSAPRLATCSAPPTSPSGSSISRITW